MIAPDDIVVEIAASHGAAGVGLVVEAGERGAVFLGKRVLVGPIDPCGECEVCRKGGAPVCPLAKRRDRLDARVTVAARWVVGLQDGLELPDAIAARVPGDIALAYTIYARTNLAPREPVVIVGTGDIARFLVQILVHKAIVPTVVVDPDGDGDYADFVLGAGAALARIGGGASEAEARAIVLATFAAQQIGNRPWRVLATTPASTARAAALAGPRATLTVVAGCPDLPAALVAREVTILTVAAAHPDLVVEVAALCAKGDLKL